MRGEDAPPTGEPPARDRRTGPDGPPPAPDGDAVELTEEALARWGRRLGEAATGPGEGAGVFVALHGPLGAGKTTLVRAACRGAGVEGAVRSPTFTLHNHHRPPGRRPIHHVDLYRLEGPEDLDDLGWDDLLGARGVVFVEWAERAGDRLPDDRWEVRLGMAEDPDRRRIDAGALGRAPPLPPPGDAEVVPHVPDRADDEPEEGSPGRDDGRAPTAAADPRGGRGADVPEQGGRPC